MQKYIGNIILLVALIVLGFKAYRKVVLKVVEEKSTVVAEKDFSKVKSKLGSMKYCITKQDIGFCDEVEKQSDYKLLPEEGVRVMRDTFYLTLVDKSLYEIVGVPSSIKKSVKLEHLIEKVFLGLSLENVPKTIKKIELSVINLELQIDAKVLSNIKLDFEKLMNTDLKLLRKSVHAVIYFNSKLRYNKLFDKIRL